MVTVLSSLTHWSRDKMATVSQVAYSNAFFNENVWILITISLKFVPKDPINNIPALVLVMAWYQSGNMSLAEPMKVRLSTHICITWLQSVKMFQWCLCNYGTMVYLCLLLNLVVLKSSLGHTNIYQTYIEGLVQDCSISIANALEIMQSGTDHLYLQFILFPNIPIVQAFHYRDVMMNTMVSQITGVLIVYSTVCSGGDQRKHQSSASLALWGEFTSDRWIPHTKGQ